MIHSTFRLHSCCLLWLAVLPAHADSLAKWTFDNLGAGTVEQRLPVALGSSGAAAGVFASPLQLQPHLLAPSTPSAGEITFAGFNNVPAGDYDGFGFGLATLDKIMFFHRANYFNNSSVPTPRPLESDRTYWGQPGVTAGIDTSVANSPMSFTVTSDAISTTTVESLTITGLGPDAYIVFFQEGGAEKGPDVTAGAAESFSASASLNAPVVIPPGVTKTFTVNWNSGSLDSKINIDQMELFGSVTRNPSPSVAQWTFNTGATSADRLASSNVSAGLTVTALQMNPKADDVGVNVNPNTVNDGFGFGGNSGEQVMFFHRANYFNTSATPDPRPVGRFTTWGGPNIAAGVDTTVDNSPMSFTVTTDASTTVTIDSISTNSIVGVYSAYFQEAGALPGASTTADSSNGFDVTPTLKASVVILPNSSKTFTVNWNSGSLNSNTLLNQIDLNGMVSSAPGDPYTAWAETTHGLLGMAAAFGFDADNDGMANGIEFVLGGNPNVSDTEILPTIETTATELIFTFRLADAAAYLNPFAEYSSNLSTWTPAMDGENGITVSTSAEPVEPGIHEVTVTLPKSLANGAQFFARLSVTNPSTP